MNDASLQEELFCLKFELDALSEVTIKRTSERWLPGFAFKFVENDHVKRYEWAYPYVKDKDVLDVACGVGKGSFMMAEHGKALSVVGCDINSDAIRYARHRNKRDNVLFNQANALELPYNDQFDAVVSFETIEHIPDVELYLSKVLASLKPGGIFLVSTPVSAKDHDRQPENPYHIQEWGFASFQTLINQYFSIESVFVQLYPYRSKNIAVRIFNAAKRRFAYSEVFDIGISVISEYTHQFPVQEIGTNRIGYQVLVCKKRQGHVVH